MRIQFEENLAESADDLVKTVLGNYELNHLPSRSSVLPLCTPLIFPVSTNFGNT